MRTVTFDLENCYGIGEMHEQFDFSASAVHVVYAPNGFMKTSFARTLADISTGARPSDLMFPSRTTTCSVRDEAGNMLAAGHVLVIPPYDAEYQPSNLSTLLVDQSLKARYEAAVGDIEGRRRALLDALRSATGITGHKVTPDSELRRSFGLEDLLDGLDQLTAAASAADAALAAVPYSTVFSQSAEKFLNDAENRAKIEDYIGQFGELVATSPILSAQFTHTRAQGVHKSLAESRFFDVQHHVVLNEDGVEVKFTSAAALKERFDRELQRVLTTPALKSAFDAFDKRITANVELRDLRDWLREHPEHLTRLSDLSAFRRDVWGAHLAQQAALLERLAEGYSDGRTVIAAVVAAAQAQSTDWARVVELFNARFDVPFRLIVENQADVILKADAPRVAFVFVDGADTAAADGGKLRAVLSQGERRALYLLNVLFEIEVRTRAAGEVLLVVDDVADSFDYRNKYAIIEYLADVCASGRFKLVVLTHNFDFYRSVSGRLHAPRQNRRHAVRVGRRVTLAQDKYMKHNPFEVWRDNLTDPANFIASVPFVRNLAQYTGRGDVFARLTEALHEKAGTATLTLDDVDNEFAKVIHGYTAPIGTRAGLFRDLLNAEAARIDADPAEHAELERKLVLSIAIRLHAERHMIARIADPTWVATITVDQTRALLAEYRRRFPTAAELPVLGQVQLMTPENIHVNSFMYEPILDLGITHLKRLYREVCLLRT